MLDGAVAGWESMGLLHGVRDWGDEIDEYDKEVSHLYVSRPNLRTKIMKKATEFTPRLLRIFWQTQLDYRCFTASDDLMDQVLSEGVVEVTV